MKKIIGILTILLIFVISLGFFFNSESSFMNVFYREFDTTINIVTKPENIENNIQDIQNIAKKNNISLIKEVNEPKNTRYEKQKLTIYIYLHDSSWFEKSFKNIEIIENNDDLNKFKKLESISLLTTKDVNLLPFSDIDQSFFNGDYHIKGSIDNIKSFLNDLSDYNLESKIDSSFNIASEFTQKQLFLYIASTLILFTSIIFCFVIYNGSLSKEIAIVNLLGYDKINFCINKTFRLLRLPLLISGISFTGILYFLTKPSSLKAYIFSSSKIYSSILFTVFV